MLRHLTAAVCFITIIIPGCTVVYHVQGQEDGDTGSGSWTAQTTGEIEEGTSEGDESTSGGEATTGIDDTGDTSTSGIDGSTSTTGADDSTGDESTSTGEPIEETSSTGEAEPPVGLPTNALCQADSDCASGVCLPNILSEDHADERRCSIPCVPDTATSCQDEGHSGLCLWGGGDQHWCTGVFPKAIKSLALPPPADQGDSLFQDAYDLPSSEWSRFFLIPAHASEFYIEIGALKGNGFGPVVFDLLSYDGATISTHTFTGQDGVYSYDKVFVQPKGAEYHYLKISPAEGVNLAKGQMHLKNPYWPNNP